MTNDDRPDYAFWREGMWDTDDAWRRYQRALRDLKAGRPVRDLIVKHTFAGGDSGREFVSR